MHFLSSNTKLGVLVVGAAVVTLAFGLATPEGWVQSSAATEPHTNAIASPEKAALQVPVTFQTAPASTRAGDEGYWLGRANPELPPFLMPGVTVGDRITIGGKSGPIRVLEVIDIKPLPSGLLPIATASPPLQTAAPQFSLVTAKIVGSAGPLTRFVIENAPAGPAGLQSPGNKAL